jgi:hypothetical protein
MCTNNVVPVFVYVKGMHWVTSTTITHEYTHTHTHTDTAWRRPLRVPVVLHVQVKGMGEVVCSVSCGFLVTLGPPTAGPGMGGRVFVYVLPSSST